MSRSVTSIFAVLLLAAPLAAQAITLDPSMPVAGETVDLVLTVNGPVRALDRVDWVLSGGRSAARGWTEPQVESSKQPGYVDCPDIRVAVLVPLEQDSPNRTIQVKFLRALGPFDSVQITMHNARANTVAHARSVEAHLRRNRSGTIETLGSVQFASQPADPTALFLSAPTWVGTSAAIPVRASVLDRHFNSTPSFTGSIAVELIELASGTAVQQGQLSLQQGFGSFTLPLGLPEGAYVFRVLDGEPLAGESPPFLVVPPEEESLPILWGDLHVHGEFSEDAFRIGWEELALYARDVAMLDFLVATDHDVGFLLDPPQGYPSRFEAMKAKLEAAQTGTFFTYPGYEWTSDGSPHNSDPRYSLHSWGHRQVFFRRFEEASLYPSTAGPLNTNDFPELVLALDAAAPSGWLAITHHLGSPFLRQWWRGGPWWGPIEGVDQDLLEEHCGIAELYSAMGGQESRVTDGDPWRMQRVDEEWQIVSAGLPTRRFRDACAAGKAFGVVGTSDGHEGLPGLGFDRGRSYPRGLTAVYAGRNRHDLFSSIVQHKTYATSGPRIAILATLEGRIPGQAVSISPPSLSLYLKVAGTAPLRKVVLVRDGLDYRTWDYPAPGKGRYAVISTHLPALPGIYYLRVEQDGLDWAGEPADSGERAWTSPWRVRL